MGSRNAVCIHDCLELRRINGSVLFAGSGSALSPRRSALHHVRQGPRANERYLCCFPCFDPSTLLVARSTRLAAASLCHRIPRSLEASSYSTSGSAHMHLPSHTEPPSTSHPSSVGPSSTSGVPPHYSDPAYPAHYHVSNYSDSAAMTALWHTPSYH